MIEIADPVNIVGDIHGQYYDLVKILDLGGDPQNHRFLFLGDYVDRGMFSVECMTILMALKICFPANVTMIRGNHECRQMTQTFNFKQECLHKFNQAIYDQFITLFDTLPISALINGKFIAFHGGISPELTKLSQINTLNRFQEPPKSGALCDIVWSDPIENDTGKFPDDSIVKHNSSRGCSYVFGTNLLTTFLKNNKLISLIRAHEVQLEGYKTQFWASKSFPQVITIFSAPNYCDTYKNKGAIIKFENNNLNIRQYLCSEHPYYLSNFMSVFEWSLPFVANQMTTILLKVLDGALEGVQDEAPKNDENAAINYKLMKNKLLFIASMSKMNQTLKDESQRILEIKRQNNMKLPMGLLTEGKKAIRGYFADVKESDKLNEMRPT